MTDQEFDAAISRSGLDLTPETMAELRAAVPGVLAQVARATRSKPREAEPGLVFYPEQRP